MNNNSILLIDPAFDPQLSEKLSLVVKISADTFSYAIIDDEQKLVYAVYDEQECENGYQKLNERLKIDSYLKLPYQNVKVAAHTQNLICVPNELLENSNISTQSSYFTAADSENMYAQPTANSDFTTIFSLPKLAERTMNENWPNSKKFQLNAGLLNLASYMTNDTIIIDFSVGCFEFIYVKDKKIIFQQTYQFDGTEEFTYFLLLALKQLNVDTQLTQLKTCGIIHLNDEKWNCLTEYFNSVDFLTIKLDINTDILEDMPTHYYTSLLSLYTCES